MCFSMMISNRISDAEASSSKCQNCYQPFYRQHNSRPPFPGFPFGFLCNRRVTVPPQRADRLPCMVAPKYIIPNPIVRTSVRFQKDWFSRSTSSILHHKSYDSKNNSLSLPSLPRTAAKIASSYGYCSSTAVFMVVRSFPSAANLLLSDSASTLKTPKL